MLWGNRRARHQRRRRLYDVRMDREKGQAKYLQTTFARGVRPSSLAFSADMRMRADAPSLRGEELAAVMLPPCLKADLREGTFS